jgi:hypothetical protein
MVNWHASPIRTPLGILITPAKSFTLICEPIPNMIIWNSGTIRPLQLKIPDFQEILGEIHGCCHGCKDPDRIGKATEFIKSVKTQGQENKKKSQKWSSTHLQISNENH